MRIRLLYLFTSIGTQLFFCNNLTFAQVHARLSSAETDSIINLRSQEIDKIDTVFSMHGTTKFFERKLGFIKLRTGKGESRKMKILHKDSLFIVRKIDIKFKKKRNEVFIYDYYFFNKKLVKYETLEYWESKSSEFKNLRHKLTLYFYASKVLESQSEINDRFKIEKINIDKVIENAINIEKEYQLTTKPSS